MERNFSPNSNPTRASPRFESKKNNATARLWVNLANKCSSTDRPGSRPTCPPDPDPESSWTLPSVPFELVSLHSQSPRVLESSRIQGISSVDVLERSTASILESLSRSLHCNF